MAEIDFTYDVSTSGPAPLVRLEGEFDMAAAHQVESEFASLISTRPEEVVVDLSGLTFLDTTGLHVLLGLHEASQREGFRLSIVRGGEQIARVFDITGLDSVLPLIEQVPDGHS